jgi:hypothetical protein
VDAARAAYAEALALRRAAGERIALADALHAAGALEQVAGDAVAARPLLAEALRCARAATLPNLACLAQVRLALLPGGDLDGARETFARQQSRIPYPRRIAAAWALAQATGDEALAAESRRLLDDLIEHAPPSWRDALVDAVPLHRAIAASGPS